MKKSEAIEMFFDGLATGFGLCFTAFLMSIMRIVKNNVSLILLMVANMLIVIYAIYSAIKTYMESVKT